MFLEHEIYCRYSGAYIGKLTYETVAGHMPYLSHWKEAQAMHPAFSMPTGKLLAYARGEYNRLMKLSEDGEATARQNQILQVCWLAVFHSLGSVKQEAVALPSIQTVQSTLQKLFALAYWRYKLDSKRFAFPEFKINRANANTRFENAGHYLDACWDIKRDYESKIEELDEAEKAKAAEAALRALRNSWIVPVSKKALWAWVRAHLPAEHAADAQGWMSTIFLGSDRTVLDFDLDEVEMMEHIILGNCPAGTGVLTAVRTRIDEIKKVHTDRREAFTIDLTVFDEEITKATGTKDAPLPEPQLKDYPNKVAWIKARAAWFLGQSDERKLQGLAGSL